MIELTRSVRFAVNPPVPPGGPIPAGRDALPPVKNGYAGVPALLGLGAHYELLVSCQGEIHPVYGYLIDIKQVDKAIRSTIVPAIAHATHAAWQGQCQPIDPAKVLLDAMPAAEAALGGILRRVRWHLTPTYSLEAHAMTTTPSTSITPSPSTTKPHGAAVAILRQRFDFAASHRLHNPTLTDADNRAMYGKCNNPRGHGHNYQFEPAVDVPVGSAFGIWDLERLADEVILERFDHKNLNEDTAEFRDGSGANPSVENIAVVFHRLLDAAMRERHPGVRLRSVRVWETDRTSATYPVGD